MILGSRALTRRDSTAQGNSAGAKTALLRAAERQNLRAGLSRLFLVLAALGFTSCTTYESPRSAEKDPQLGQASAAIPAGPYLRVVSSDARMMQLQIAVRKLVPARGSGPAVWLTGASHIGDSNYFNALQEHLDAQALVLFEGVGGPAAGHHATHRRGRASPRTSHSPADGSTTGANQENQPVGLQGSLAESLGLVFQLSAIDYDRPHFRNSDLSIQEIQRLIQGAARADSAKGNAANAGGEFQQLLQIMDERSFPGAIAKLMVTLLGSSPKLQAITKLALIETLGQVQGDLSQMQALPPEMKNLVQVLIQARNQTVLNDLKAELKRKSPPGSVAIFYGAGHMADLEKRLTHELHYRAAGQFWLTAFAVDLEKAGVTDAELQVIRSFVAWQMEALRQ